MLLLVGELGPKFVDLVLFDPARQFILFIVTGFVSQFVLMLLTLNKKLPRKLQIRDVYVQELLVGNS